MLIVLLLPASLPNLGKFAVRQTLNFAALCAVLHFFAYCFHREAILATLADCSLHMQPLCLLHVLAPHCTSGLATLQC